MKELSEVAQLSLPSDDAAEADSGLNTETTNQYVWVSQQSAPWMMYYSSVFFSDKAEVAPVRCLLLR